MLEKVREYFRHPPKSLVAFFEGRIYPLCVCILVFWGYALRLEVFSNAIVLLSLALGLCISSSIRPLIAPLIVILFQLSPSHSPSSPAFSDYLVRPAVLYPTLSALALAVGSLVFRLVRIGVRETVRSPIPFLIPSLLLSAAFLTNGAFASVYTPRNLVIGLVEVLGFFLVFYLFHFGLSQERGEDIVDYFIYVSLLIAMLLSLETLWLYATGGVVVSGSAVKENLLYGWGIWNNCGQALAVTIPVLFLGAMRSRIPWVYLLGVAISFFAVMLTLSRSSLLVSLLAVVVCSVIGCFFGKSKRIFRLSVPLFAIAAFALGLLFWDKISTLLEDFLNRGLSDNGRLSLWQAGIEGFVKNPVFGKGFFGFESAAADSVYLYVDFFPRMLHNTVAELLGAMGIFGLASYLLYRVSTVRAFVVSPCLAKTMLGVSILTLLLQSLLDNFVFYVQPMFYYSIALAIALKLEGRAGNCESALS